MCMPYQEGLSTDMILLASGRQPAVFNQGDEHGKSLLMYCTDPLYVDILVEMGANVNWCNSSGKTALMLTADNKDVIICLLKHGADVNLRDEDHDAALDYAIAYGYLDVVKILVEAGADIGPCLATGETPLIQMCIEQPCSRAGIQYLIERGCPVDHVNNLGHRMLFGLGAAVIISWCVQRHKNVKEIDPCQKEQLEWQKQFNDQMRQTIETMRKHSELFYSQ